VVENICQCRTLLFNGDGMVKMLMSQVLHSTVVDVNFKIKLGDANAYGVRCPKKTRRIIVLKFSQSIIVNYNLQTLLSPT
jgi:hypothetical protein